MSSTTSSPSAFVSLPHSRRRVLWIGAVLVIGIFFGVFFSRGTPQGRHTGANATRSALNVPASPAALGVARSFLETGVARTHLEVAYRLVGPWLKAGQSRKQWLTGNNPVVFFPAKNLKTARLRVTSSTTHVLSLDVGPLVLAKRRKIGGIRSIPFKMEVDRIAGKWLVNYFVPDYPLLHGRP